MTSRAPSGDGSPKWASEMCRIFIGRLHAQAFRSRPHFRARSSQVMACSVLKRLTRRERCRLRIASSHAAFSAYQHLRLGTVDGSLVRRLSTFGVMGAVLGTREALAIVD